MIRVVVAEDSPTARHLLVAMLESDPELKVVGEANNGRQAVELVERLSPDLVTMDVEMPEIDGLAATQQIMMRRPTPIIVISSQVRERAVALSFEATRAGALLVLPKPESPGASGFEQQRSELVSMAKAMAAVKVVRRWGAPAPANAPRVSTEVPRMPGTRPSPSRKNLTCVACPSATCRTPSIAAAVR